MAIQATKFTPEVLLSAPRRSPVTGLNTDGTLGLYSVSTYSFETHSKKSELRVLDVRTGSSKLLSNDLKDSEPTWLGWKNEVVWLRGGEKGVTDLLSGDVDDLEAEYDLPSPAVTCTHNFQTKDYCHIQWPSF